MLGISRTKMTAGDPIRGQAVAWNRDGTLLTFTDGIWMPPSYTLKPATGPAIKLPRLTVGKDDSAAPVPWDANYAGRFAIPLGTTPGAYTIDFGGGNTAKITVVAPSPARHVATIAPGNSLALATVYLKAGYDLILAPGRHVWEHVLHTPVGASIWAYGARIERVPDTDSHQRMIAPANGLSVYGGDWCPTDDGWMLLPDGTADDVALVDVNLMRGALGCGFTQFVARDCTFRGFVSNPAPGEWLRCHFLDPQSGFGSGPQDHGLAVIDGLFSRTGRGPFSQPGPAGYKGTFWQGTSLRDIDWTANGSEIWLTEGGPVADNLITHTRIKNCAGTVFQSDGGGSGYLVRDFTMDGGLGVVFNGTGHVLRDFELQRAGIYCDGKGCQLIDGAVIDFAPTRGNQAWRNPSNRGDSRRTAIWADGPDAATNTLSNVNAVCLAVGVLDVQGFKAVGPLPG